MFKKRQHYKSTHDRKAASIRTKKENQTWLRKDDKSD